MRQAFESRAARIAEAQGHGDLVEGLSGGVVDRRADAAAAADARDGQKLAVPPRRQQEQIRVRRGLGETNRDRMSLQVIDRDEGQIVRQRDRLARRKADHDAADQSRTCGRCNAVQRIERQPGTGHGLGYDGVDHLDMGSGGDFRHDAAIGRMAFKLRGDDRRQHLDPITDAHDRGCGFVAARLDSKHGQWRNRHDRVLKVSDRLSRPAPPIRRTSGL